MRGLAVSRIVVFRFYSDRLRQFIPPPSVFRRVKPFRLTYDQVESDLTRIIHTTALINQDQTCVSLSYEELRNECFAKVAHVIDRGWMDRARSRVEFFRIVVTSINNHVRSLIQRHRFTQKRTGLKPPPKAKRQEMIREEKVAEKTADEVIVYRQTKPVEISMNDEDAGLQVGADESDQRGYADFREEIIALLNLRERAVFSQMIEPNEDALHLAWEDAHRGVSDGQGINVRIRETHLAEGGGWKLNDYMEIQGCIRQKVLKFMEDEKNDNGFSLAYAAASALLKQAFGLQVPASVAEEVKRRLYSIAARNQYYKIEGNQQIRDALETVGAMVPEVSGDKLRCFGILFKENNRICNCCGVRTACQTKAANFGLGTITISPKLLGPRNIRIPVITPVRPAQALEAHRGGNTEDEDEILDFLCETFKRVIYSGEVYFQHKDAIPGDMRKRPFIFGLGKATVPLRLRFINPADALQNSLRAVKSPGTVGCNWYLPENASAKIAIDLMRMHAEKTFAEAPAPV